MRFVTKCFLILLPALTSGLVGAASPTSTETPSTQSPCICAHLRRILTLRHLDSGLVMVGLGIYLLLPH